MVIGRIKATTGGVVLVQLGQRAVGTIALTDLHDAWRVNALAGVEVGTVIRACVVGMQGDTPQLSVRASDGGVWGRVPANTPGTTAAAQTVGDDHYDERKGIPHDERKGKQHDKGREASAGKKNPTVTTVTQPPDTPCPTTLDVTHDVHVGQPIHGYIKAITKAGAFVVLARNLEARVRLNQLQDGFVKDPAAVFPVGSLFGGRVVGVRDGRYGEGWCEVVGVYVLGVLYVLGL